MSSIDPRLVKTWVHLIRNGRKTIGDVPASLREAVEAELARK